MDSVIERQKSIFKLHHVPNWFRRSILKARREGRIRSYHDIYSCTGWDTYIFLENALGTPRSYIFDHIGSYGKSFISQPYMSVEVAKPISDEIASLLNIHVACVDKNSIWGFGTIWVEWTELKTESEP